MDLDIDSVHKDFEDWMAVAHPNISMDRYKSGRYVYLQAQCRWEPWYESARIAYERAAEPLNPTLKGFKDEAELIGFINEHKPWRIQDPLHKIRAWIRP